jgi:UDP-2,3-diacylglucosamine pyrophosphatase LpxH
LETKLLNIDKSEKILIVADLHLGKANDKVSTRRVGALIKLIKNYHNIIINGDLAESWLLDGKEFISNYENILFNIFKQKNVYYICGNHDEYGYFDPQYANSIFKYYGEKFILQIDSHKYHIEHGHKLGQKPKILSIYAKILNYFAPYSFRILGKSSYLINSMPYIDSFNIFGKYRNNKIKKNKTSDFMILSDTHYGEIDLKAKFANTGAFGVRQGTAIEVSKHGNIKLIKLDI